MKELTFKQTMNRVGLAFFAFMVTAQLTAAAVITLVQAFAPALYAQPWFLSAAGTLPIYVFAVPVLLLILRTIPNGSATPPKENRPLWYLLMFIPLGIAGLYLGNMVGLLVTTLIGLLRGANVVNPLESMVMESGLTLITVLILTVVGPLMEEFIFRYALYKKLGRFGDKAYIVASAALFALFHGNLSQLVYAFVLGALFAYLYCRTGNILLPAALHMFVNFLGSVVSLSVMNNQSALAIFSMFVLLMLVGGVAIALLRYKHITLHTGVQPIGPHPVRDAVLNAGMLLSILLCCVLIVLVSVVL